MFEKWKRVEELEAKIKRLEEERFEARKDRQEAMHRANKAESERDKLQAEKDRIDSGLRFQLQYTQRALKDLGEELTAAHQSRVELMAKLARITSQRDEARAEIAELKCHCTEQEAELKTEWTVQELDLIRANGQLKIETERADRAETELTLVTEQRDTFFTAIGKCHATAVDVGYAAKCDCEPCEPSSVEVTWSVRGAAKTPEGLMQCEEAGKLALSPYEQFAVEVEAAGLTARDRRNEYWRIGGGMKSVYIWAKEGRLVLAAAENERSEWISVAEAIKLAKGKTDV